MKLHFSRRVLGGFLLAAWASVTVAAVPVEPPVQRMIMDQFERTTEVRVVGVTADALEVIRDADKARFSIPLQKLSAADQAFASGLLKKIEAAKPLPDTTWLQTIRRDFQRYDADKKQFLALGAEAFVRDPILVVGITDNHVPESVFDSRAGRVLPSGERVAIEIRDEAPVLWILVGGELSDLHVAARKLPEGHAMLSHTARERALKRAIPLRTKAVSDWLKRNPVRESGRIEFSDEETEQLRSQIARVQPDYWFEPLAGIYRGRATNTPMPVFGAFYRDGSPVLHNGAAIKGHRSQVMSLLRQHKRATAK